MKTGESVEALEMRFGKLQLLGHKLRSNNKAIEQAFEGVRKRYREVQAASMLQRDFVIKE